MNIERLDVPKNLLGEGPWWDERRQRLFWVDSVGRKIMSLLLDDNAYSEWQVPSMIGSMALCADDTDGDKAPHDHAIVALADALYHFDFNSLSCVLIEGTEIKDERVRDNDGIVDRSGNFVVGSMGIKIRDQALGKLVRLNTDFSVEVLEEDVIVANGPCFSPDGGTFYFNDGRRRILSYDYDQTLADQSFTVKGETLTNKKVFLQGADFDTGTDGATVDSQGNIWAAMIGSAEVGCFDSKGKLLERFKMPVTLPSSVMFGGPDLSDLFVTSISDSGNRQAGEANAGSLFRITGLGVKGIAEPRFGTS